MVGKPAKGDGDRRLSCDLYEECLGFAAEKHWEGFHCGSCDYPEEKGRDPVKGTGEEKKALCADCLENEPLGNSPYCASCMAIRGARKRAEAKVLPPVKNGTGCTILDVSQGQKRT